MVQPTDREQRIQRKAHAWPKVMVLGAIAAVAVFAAGAAVAQARVTVLADEAGLAVNPKVTRGYNFGNWMSMSDHAEPMARTPAASLRFPGGNVGDEHDMNEVALNAFSSLLTFVKGQPELMIQTRVFGGRVDRPAANTPADAAAAVRLARERGLKVPYWEIGNEHYAFGMLAGLEGRFVKASSSEPQLWPHAVRNGDRMQVLLLNTQAKPLAVDLDASGRQVRRASYFNAAIVEKEAPNAALLAVKQLRLPRWCSCRKFPDPPSRGPACGPSLLGAARTN